MNSLLRGPLSILSPTDNHTRRAPIPRRSLDFCGQAMYFWAAVTVFLSEWSEQRNDRPPNYQEGAAIPNTTQLEPVPATRVISRALPVGGGMPGKKRIKVACLIFFLIALLITLLTGNRIVRTAHAFPEGPNAGVSGAPGELTCAVSGCHEGTPNTGIGQLLILVPSMYESTKTYEITVKHM